MPAPSSLNIGYLGDSNTANGFISTGCTNLLKGYGSYMTVNETVRGTGGKTSRQFQPDGYTGAEAGLLSAAVTAFNAASVTIVSINIGTNDCRVSNGITSAEYSLNMQRILAYMIANMPAGTKFVFQYPISPGPLYNSTNYSGSYDAEFASSSTSGNQRLLTYFTVLESFPNGTTVFLGSRAGYDYVANFINSVSDGVHATANTGWIIGLSWATGIAGVLGQTLSKSPAHGRPGSSHVRRGR